MAQAGEEFILAPLRLAHWYCASRAQHGMGR
jgi:hypothetical protein